MNKLKDINEFLNKYKSGNIIYRQVIRRLFENPDKAEKELLESDLVHKECMYRCLVCNHLIHLGSEIIDDALYCDNCGFIGNKHQFISQVVYVKD
jgi:hypothetical protein